MKRSLIALLVVIGLACWSVTQQPRADAPSNLELRLEASAMREGLPHSFTFRMVNISNHDVRVPTPMVGCSGQSFGAVWLRFRLDPSPGGVPGTCIGGWGDLPSVMFQAKHWWKALRPGESLTVSVPREQLSYDEKPARRIEFWGQYDPPILSLDDQRALMDAGIDFPHSPIESAHLTFLKKP